MIVVTGTIEVAPEGTDAARAAAEEMMRETRKEDGCFVYEFSQLIEAPGRFRVYEEWRDLDALAAHGKTPHMARFRTALADVGVLSRDVAWMEAGAKTSL